MSAHYDLAIAGGGLGGAALAKSMADRGARVLVIEHERQFKDRVRGEMMSPWGYAEANALGVAECLGDKATGLATGMLSAGWIFMPSPSECSIAKSPTPHRSISLAWRSIIPLCRSRCSERRSCGSHSAPRRGRSRSGARCGAVIGSGGKWPPETFSARLVVGADGRSSVVRSSARFPLLRDPEDMLIAGVLLENVHAAEDTAEAIHHFGLGQFVVIAPQGGGRVRMYLCYHAGSGARFQGHADLPSFVEGCRTSARTPHISKMPGPLVR